MLGNTWSVLTSLRAPGLSHITRRKVTSPNGIARWRKVTSHGGKSHHFATIPMAQRHSTENRKVTKSSRDIAHSEIFVDFRKKFASNTNGKKFATERYDLNRPLVPTYHQNHLPTRSRRLKNRRTFFAGPLLTNNALIGNK